MIFYLLFTTLLAHGELSGRTEVIGSSFLQSIDSELDEKQIDLVLRPELRFKKYGWSYRFLPDVEFSTSQRHALLDVEELFLRRKWKSQTTLTLGVNTYTWGVTDGYNPLDVINPRDFQQPLHARKRGSLGLHINQALSEHVQIEGLYIPWQLPSRLPSESSRWLPREVFLPAGTEEGTRIILPDHVNYSFRENLDAGAFRHNFGGRLQVSEGSREWSLIFFDGMSSIPLLQAEIVTGAPIQVFPEITVAIDPDVTLQPVYYRQRVVGGSLVWSLNEIIMRYQTAYTRERSHIADVSRWSFENVLALEKSWSMLGADTTFILQGTFNQRAEDHSSSSSGLSGLLDRAVMGGVRISPNMYWEAFIFGGADTRGDGSLLGVSLNHTLHDHWKTELRGDFLQGPESSWMGSFRKNDQVFLKVIYLL